MEAGERDRARAPRLDVPADAEPPEALDLAEVVFVLDATTDHAPWPGEGTWVVCCSRPATLLSCDTPFESVPDDAVVHFTEEELCLYSGLSAGKAARVVALLDDEGPSGLFARLSPVRRWLAGYRARIEAARHGAPGTHLFQCWACGRLYLGSHTTA